MRADLEKMYFGNYKFTVELDTGSETGGHQLTVWVAEKVDVDAVPLSQFSLDQLFRALKEPQQSLLRAQLEEKKTTCRQSFDEAINRLQQPFKDTAGQQRRLPGDVRRQLRALRDQKKKDIRELEKAFIRRELGTLDRQCFDRTLLERESRVFSESRFLRNFYFEEANDRYIYNFCRKFALDSAYRAEVLAKKVRWMKRNRLFVRNICHMLGDEPAQWNERTYEHQLRQLFTWIDTHVEDILALPEYQYFEQLDSAFQPNANELDPLIRPAVDALNQVPGVTTGFSCQGVSGTVQFEGRDLLVVSPHEEYAYVSFAVLEESARDALLALLPKFPSIVGRFPATSDLRSRALRSASASDNLCFREEVVELARQALDVVKA